MTPQPRECPLGVRQMSDSSTGKCVKSVRWTGRSVVVDAEGDVDLSRSGEFQQALLAVMDSRPDLIIVNLAGLRGIPSELYDAAKIDGAGRWQSFRRVTIPMISPVLLYNLVIVLIGTFQYFTQAYTMTNGKGDPNNATLFMNLVLYREGFVFNHMGYAAAIAWLLFVIVLILTLVLFWFSRSRVYYAGGDR